MSAPTYLLVTQYRDAPQQPERDYDPDLDDPIDPDALEGNRPIPKKRGRTRTTNVSRAGIRIGTDDDGQPLAGGGFTNPVRRRVERMRTSSGFTAAEEAELKQGFAAIQGLMSGQPADVPGPDEPTDAEVEAVYNQHAFDGTPRAHYCRTCFKSRRDPVHG